MSRRLYIGRLPQEASSDDLSKLFEPHGRVVDCRVMTGFGFVEFEEARDAQEAIDKTDGRDFQGAPILVEFAKENTGRRERRPPFEDRGERGAPRTRRPPGIRVIVSGLSRDTSWQDLKDFGREAGNVSFSDIDRDAPGDGILEYLSRDDAERAVRDLTGKTVRGRDVKVTFDDGTRGGGGVDNYRREGGGSDRGGGSRRPPRDDDYPRRDDYRRRSRSPPRRRSPPPRRRDYEYDSGRREGGGGSSSSRRDPVPRDEDRGDRGYRR